jgi:hypothetical protein
MKTTMSSFSIRLCVKSAKVITGAVKATYRLWGVRVSMRYDDEEFEPNYDYVLAEDTQKTVEMVRRLARVHGLEVEVLDVARENVLRRVLQEEREGIRAFPTLVAGSERRVEGEITEEQVESLFSRIAEGTRRKYL